MKTYYVNLAAYYWFNRADRPAWETNKKTFVDTFYDAMRENNVGRLWKEKYQSKRWDDGFEFTAFGTPKTADLHIREFGMTITDKGVDFYVNGKKDFEITNRQINELDKIGFNLKKSSGTLKGILEYIAMYIENFAITNKELYAA